MYTPAQVSDMLHIPVSTLRRYASDYSEYLSDQARRSDKSRRYNGSDILIFEKARELLQAGHSSEHVKALIPITNIDLQPDTSLAKILGIANEIQALNDQAAEMRELIFSVIERYKAYDQRISDTEKMITDLTGRLDQIEQNKRKSWLRKLIDKLDRVID